MQKRNKAEQVMKKIILKVNITTYIENKHKNTETSALIHPRNVKKSHTCEEGWAQLRISFWHLLMNLKNN